MHTIKLAIAEDQTIYRLGLVELLKEYVDITITCTAKNGKELLKKIKGLSIDLIIMDDEMPEMNGKQTLKLLNQFYPTIRVICITRRSSVANIRTLVRSGARTVLSKSVGIDILVQAIREVYVNEYFFFGVLTHELMIIATRASSSSVKINAGDSFTKREIEIVQLICDGRSNGEISLLLSLSQRTIENHRRRMMKKAGSRTTATLIVFAIRNGYYEI